MFEFLSGGNAEHAPIFQYQNIVISDFKTLNNVSNELLLDCIKIIIYTLAFHIVLPLSLDFNLATLSLVAFSSSLNCFLQSRAFQNDNSEALDVLVTLEQLAVVNGIRMLFTFSAATGRLQTSSDGLNNNAVCIPLACDNVENAGLTAVDSSSNPLLAVAFPDGVFDASESADAPVAISTSFSFRMPILASSGTNRSLPFFGSVGDCQAQGSENSAVANPADYLSFMIAPLLTPTASSDRCFVKVMVRDCFPTTRISTNSLDVITGNSLSTRTEDVTTFMEVPTTSATVEPITTDFVGSGVDPSTTDQPATIVPTTPPATPDPTQCSAATSTVRIACIRYECGSEVRIRALADTSTDTLNEFGRDCDVSQTAPLLSARFFTNNPGTTDVIIDTSDLVASDYNNPDLGLYFEAGNSATALQVAEERCNAGRVDATSPTIEIDNGVTAEFTCYNN